MKHSFTFNFSRFNDFFTSLQKFGKVYAPVKVSEKSYSFKEVKQAGEISLEALRTILPPKKLFFTPEEKIIHFKDNDVFECIPDIGHQVLFGVHPCDLAGLNIMDKIFLESPTDTHYLRRRRETLIVGLSCMPDKYCFCDSMNCDSINGAYDIFLTKLDNIEKYFVQIQSPEGLRLIDNALDFINSATESDKLNYKEFWSERSKCFTSKFDSRNLVTLMDMEWDNKIWEELGNKCLSCGNCTPVCPTCYCFDLIDISQLDGSGTREREWDSCQIAGFAKVSGDFNFRPGPVDRLKYWYRHKLHGFEDAYGFPTCVGCGRCTISCPAEIDDIVGVVLNLQGKNSHE